MADVSVPLFHAKPEVALAGTSPWELHTAWVPSPNPALSSALTRLSSSGEAKAPLVLSGAELQALAIYWSALVTSLLNARPGPSIPVIAFRSDLAKEAEKAGGVADPSKGQAAIALDPFGPNRGLRPMDETARVFVLGTANAVRSLSKAKQGSTLPYIAIPTIPGVPSSPLPNTPIPSIPGFPGLPNAGIPGLGLGESEALASGAAAGSTLLWGALIVGGVVALGYFGGKALEAKFELDAKKAVDMHKATVGAQLTQARWEAEAKIGKPIAPSPIEVAAADHVRQSALSDETSKRYMTAGIGLACVGVGLVGGSYVANRWGPR